MVSFASNNNNVQVQWTRRSAKQCKKTNLSAIFLRVYVLISIQCYLELDNQLSWRQSVTAVIFFKRVMMKILLLGRTPAEFSILTTSWRKTLFWFVVRSEALVVLFLFDVIGSYLAIMNLIMYRLSQIPASSLGFRL